jgi:poly-gamma-glutamate synthesis protein (capsule biosynthesis protein)
MAGLLLPAGPEEPPGIIEPAGPLNVNLLEAGYTDAPPPFNGSDAGQEAADTQRRLQENITIVQLFSGCETSGLETGGAQMLPASRSVRTITWLPIAGVCICLFAPLVARAADAPATVKLIFVGDIMVAHDEETGRLIERGEDPFEPFAGLLKEADVAVGNLECVIAEKGEPVPKPFQFLAYPRCIPVLKKHFTALTVANNHSGDFGKLALVEQCERLEKADLPYFGGGRNKSDAHKPWIVERHGIRIALLGYCEVLLRSFQAEKDLPGVAWSEYDDDVLADIKAAREKYKADE